MPARLVSDAQGAAYKDFLAWYQDNRSAFEDRARVVRDGLDLLARCELDPPARVITGAAAIFGARSREATRIFKSGVPRLDEEQFSAARLREALEIISGQLPSACEPAPCPYTLLAILWQCACGKHGEDVAKVVRLVGVPLFAAMAEYGGLLHARWGSVGLYVGRTSRGVGHDHDDVPQVWSRLGEHAEKCGAPVGIPLLVLDPGLGPECGAALESVAIKMAATVALLDNGVDGGGSGSEPGAVGLYLRASPVAVADTATEKCAARRAVRAVFGGGVNNMPTRPRNPRHHHHHHHQTPTSTRGVKGG